MGRKYKSPSRTKWLVVGVVIGLVLGYVLASIQDPMMLFNDPMGAIEAAFNLQG